MLVLQKRNQLLTRLVDSSPYRERDPSVLGSLTHETDDLVVGGVDDGVVVDGHDLVAAEQPPVEVGRSAGNDVADGHLGTSTGC